MRSMSLGGSVPARTPASCLRNRSARRSDLRCARAIHRSVHFTGPAANPAAPYTYCAPALRAADKAADWLAGWAGRPSRNGPTLPQAQTVELRIDQHNMASQDVAARAGFVLGGTVTQFIPGTGKTCEDLRYVLSRATLSLARGAPSSSSSS